MTTEEMNKLAQFMYDNFDWPCNFTPLDEQMADFCGDDCDCYYDNPIACWKQVFKMIGVVEE